MTNLSLVFQKEDANLGSIRPIVHASIAGLTQLKDELGPEEVEFQNDLQDGKYGNVEVTHLNERSIQAHTNVRSKYIQHLINALQDRFPDDTLDLISSLDILLNPSRYPHAQSAFQEYARDATEMVIAHFGHERACREGLLLAEPCQDITAESSGGGEIKRKFGLSYAAELQIFDETDTAVEEDILLELVEANPDLCLTVPDSFLGEVKENGGAPTCRNVSSFEVMNTSTTEVSESEAAKEMVESALLKKPGGDDVLEEYKSDNPLKHSTRRQLVNILTSHMTEMHGRIPSRKQKEKYALGIISLFPSLKDPFSRKGYEHFYDGEKNTGYLSWRLRTMSRKNLTTRSQQAVPATVPQAQGPNRPRSAPTVPRQLDEDEDNLTTSPGLSA
ncbi:hypothetical protein JOQ06_008788 [Pogonophryne albipinna]|uniref:Uncharacterized protein n=1 Tax=Pogonophryne albipinna TaxID=1090488 RepID=A0AAD6FTP3_9TELE|nr:hypothetical protein JOQ06_008788 [Pogonophryne albipinna]